MPTLKVLFLGTVRGKVGEGILENLGSYKCLNITDVKTTWPASSSDFLICIRYSEYSAGSGNMSNIDRYFDIVPNTDTVLISVLNFRYFDI